MKDAFGAYSENGQHLLSYLRAEISLPYKEGFVCLQCPSIPNHFGMWSSGQKELTKRQKRSIRVLPDSTIVPVGGLSAQSIGATSSAVIAVATSVVPDGLAHSEAASITAPATVSTISTIPAIPDSDIAIASVASATHTIPETTTETPRSETTSSMIVAYYADAGALAASPPVSPSRDAASDALPSSPIVAPLEASAVPQSPMQASRMSTSLHNDPLYFSLATPPSEGEFPRTPQSPSKYNHLC